MAKTKARKSAPSVDPIQLLETARGTLRAEGVVKLSALGPASVRAQILSQLLESGYEATKSVVRKPVHAQLTEALSVGAFIPLKGVGARVSGASAAKAKQAALALAKSGAAKLVVRGAEEVLVPADTAVVERSELTRFAAFAKTLTKLASSKTGATMLQSDFLEELSRAAPNALGKDAGGRARTGGRQQSAESGTRPRGTSGEAVALNRVEDAQGTWGALLSAVESHRDPHTGLSFVPKIVASLRGQLEPDATRAALVAAATQGILELRPEGGIHRLSEEELALCPPGPQGTRLSWARRIEDAVQ